MKRRALLGVFGVLTLVLVVGVTAQAQLAKQGKYRGMFVECLECRHDP